MKNIQSAEKLISILANLFVIFGVLFAIYQFWEIRDFEMKSNSMNLIQKTREPEFTRAFQFVSQEMRNGNRDRDQVIESLNYLANTYDYISVLYFSGNIDKEIVKQSTYQAIDVLSDIFTFYKYPENRLVNFYKLETEVNGND